MFCCLAFIYLYLQKHVVFMRNIYFLFQTEALHSIIQAAIIAGVQRGRGRGRGRGRDREKGGKEEAEAEAVEEEEAEEEEAAVYKFITIINNLVILNKKLY